MTTTIPQLGSECHRHFAPSFRLRRRAQKVVSSAHVLTSVGWFGVALMVASCGLLAAFTGDSSRPPMLHQLIETAPWLSIPMGLAAVATGVVLGLGTTFGLVRHWWVVAKIAISAAVVVTDAVLVERVAHEAVAADQAPTPLYGSTIAHVVLLAVATVLSVFEPRARTPWARRSTVAVRPSR